MSKRIENLVVKYLEAVDAEQADEVTPKQEQKAIDKQFDCMEKIEEYPKAKIKLTCKESAIERVNTFYKMYIA